MSAVTQESVRERIDQALPTLSTAQRRVALLITERQSQLGYLSATEIGRLAGGVSDATVVRTAQQLGYTGLSDLKRAIAAELAQPSLSERLQNTLHGGQDGPVQRTVAQHLDALDVLARPNMIEAAGRAVTELLRARRIFVVGTGPSAQIAGYGRDLLVRIGLDARAAVRSGVSAADDLIGLRADDAIVLLAYSNLAPHVEALVSEAMRKEIALVLLTDHLPAPTRRSIVLRTGRGSPTGSASHVTTVAMLEILALMAADEDEQRSTATLDELNRLRATIAQHTAGDPGVWPGRIRRGQSGTQTRR